ncbi:alpha/beta hydrolase [Streptomyces sp. V3I7]|uniref:alpha/beta hydrolase n=1 Tax=Streptomyces sp. V3I7 TaxID=3042278 RepID=UPI002785439B|nr:alpha/beta hydrolase [Streptomyces sp. V3I7]MDQ0993873.1 monoterpene epsilon-lactone hydrolase [Streptomyces sp. V3I7]
MSLPHRPDVPGMTAEDERELADLLDLLQADAWPEDLFEGREFYDHWGTPVAADVEVTERAVGGVPGYLLTPPVADPGRIGIWLHGGGYVFGSQRSHGGMVAEAARHAGYAFLHPQYRRAPEHKYPAALQDAVDVYAALLKEGWAPESIVVAGDSAGGGLVLAMLVAARDRGLPMPRAAACVSPWLDLAGTGETFTSKESIDPMLSRSVVDDVAAAYLAGTAPETPYVSALYAEVDGLPPVLFQVGEREMLHSDSERFAAKLAKAGVPATIEVWPGMVHVWHLHHTRLAKARTALERLGAFLRAPGAAPAAPGVTAQGDSCTAATR